MGKEKVDTRRRIIKAWYFSDESKTLRYGDNRPIAIGVEHAVKGYPEPCHHGLHGAESILEALYVAPGPIVWRVELSGRIKRGGKIIAATRRKYIAGGIDVSNILRDLARKTALSVGYLWKCPEIVRRYLETGDESIRSAAADAAASAANDPWVIEAYGAAAAVQSAIWAAASTAYAAAAVQSAIWAAGSAADAAASAAGVLAKSNYTVIPILDAWDYNNTVASAASAARNEVKATAEKMLESMILEALK
jgi:hypothetical protein